MFDGQADWSEEGLLDEAMVAVTAGELSPLMTGLIYCSVIEACQQVYALGRAREWTSALAQWCEEQPETVAFTGTCLVRRAEIMQLRGAWRVWQQVEAPYAAARVRVLVGLACRALGDDDGGRLDLEAARAVFEQLGAAPDLARIDSLTQGAPSGQAHGLTQDGEGHRHRPEGQDAPARIAPEVSPTQAEDEHVIA